MSKIMVFGTLVSNESFVYITNDGNIVEHMLMRKQ